MIRRPPRSPLFPYTPLSRSHLGAVDTHRAAADLGAVQHHVVSAGDSCARRRGERGRVDRKSTRLNSSHGYISYAVFCLKKKKKNKNNMWIIRRLISKYDTDC